MAVSFKPVAKTENAEIPEETPEGENITVCLAFLPTDMKILTLHLTSVIS